MPHMTGMELHARIAETLPVLARRTIFLSGGAFTPAARAWIERATNLILDKPLGIDRLKQAIADVMTLG
jgi:hypothetical protein